LDLAVKNSFKNFAGDRRGSVATIAALALVPITVAAGFGLDLSRAMMGRGALQDALDATALALAHMPASTPKTTLEERGQQWLTANLPNSGLGKITLVVEPATGKIVLDASADVPTVMSSLAGISNVPVKAHSEVKWGLNHVELALVLDNTGSMAGTKLSTLKTAANALIDTLVNSTDAADPDALKISVVPFSMTVRLSSSSTQLNTYKSSAWMSGVMPYTSPYNQDVFSTSNTNRFTMFTNLKTSWAGCVEARPAPYDVQDTAPNTAVKNSLFTPYFAPDEPDSNRVIKSSFYGYNFYYSFGNSYISDNITTYPTTFAATAWKTPQGQVAKYSKDTPDGDGPNNGCTGLQSLLRLTPAAQVSTIKAKITAMTASGNTNVPFGMMWGWHTLSPNLPFADGVAYGNQDTKKIMVVLTDGDNVNTNDNTPNDSSYSGLGYIWQKRLEGADENSSDSARTKAMDARMALLCQNAKTAGLVIYTVRVDVSGTAPEALKACASEEANFYDVPDVADLSKAFDAIAGSIGKLRIAN
jgi:Flp pilus assembly protein TadG